MITELFGKCKEIADPPTQAEHEMTSALDDVNRTAFEDTTFRVSQEINDETTTSPSLASSNGNDEMPVILEHVDDQIDDGTNLEDFQETSESLEDDDVDLEDLQPTSEPLEDDVLSTPLKGT